MSSIAAVFTCPPEPPFPARAPRSARGRGDRQLGGRPRRGGAGAGAPAGLWAFGGRHHPPTPFVALQSSQDEKFAWGRRTATRSCFWTAWARVIDLCVTQPPAGHLAAVGGRAQHMGGAVSRVGPTETAYLNRGALTTWTSPRSGPTRRKTTATSAGCATSTPRCCPTPPAANTSTPPRWRAGGTSGRPTARTRPAGGAQGPLRPDEPVPPQPEHPAQRGPSAREPAMPGSSPSMAAGPRAVAPSSVLARTSRPCSWRSSGSRGGRDRARPAISEPLDGGKSTCQAVAAARLGAPVTFVCWSVGRARRWWRFVSKRGHGPAG